MSRLLGSLSLFLVMISLCGCATTEREAYERLDLTHEVIRQTSNLLAADAELSRFPIEVDGFKGSMRLRGQVASEHQKSRAEKILWSVRGVRSVENHIVVQASPAQP